MSFSPAASYEDVLSLMRKHRHGISWGDFLEWCGAEIAHMPKNVIYAFTDEAIRVNGNPTKKRIFEIRLATIAAMLSGRSATFKTRFWYALANQPSVSGFEHVEALWQAIMHAEALESWEIGDQPWEKGVQDFRHELRVKHEFRRKRKKSGFVPAVVTGEFELPAFVGQRNSCDTPCPSPSGGVAYRKVSSDLTRKQRRRMWWRITQEQAAINAALHAQERKKRKPIRVIVEPDVEPVLGEKLTSHQMKRTVAAFRLGSCSYCVLQAGRQVSREERDAQQRKAAAAKAKAAYKAKPKAEREKGVRSNRDKRTPVLQGGLLNAVLGSAATVLFARIWKLMSKTDGVLTVTKEFVTSLSGYAQQLKKLFRNALWIVPFIVVCKYAYDQLDKESRKFVPLVLSAIVGKLAWPHLSEFFHGGKCVSQDGLTGGIPRLLATAFAFSVFKGKFGQRDITEFLKRIAMLERVAGGFDTFSKWIMQAFESLVNFVREKFGKDRVQMVQDCHKNLKAWLKRVDVLSRDESVGGPADSARVDEMVDLTRMAAAFKEMYRGTDLQRTVDEYTARLGNLTLPYAGAITSRNNYRQEPVMVTLVGEPGIGKTLMCPYAVVALLRDSGLVTSSDPDACMKEMWQKGTSEYWNGYCGQKALIMDDIFQARVSVAQTENEYMDVIRMVGTWIMPLNMADLPSKGKFSMMSELIFSTSNKKCVTSEAAIVLEEPGAVVRRIAFPYAVRVKEEFKLEGKLNFRMFESELAACVGKKGMDGFPWYIWEVARHNFADGSTSETWFPLRELLTTISMELRKRKETFVKTRDAIGQFSAGFSTDETPIERPELQVGVLGLAAGAAGVLIGANAADPVSVWGINEATRMAKERRIPISQALSEVDEEIRRISYQQCCIRRLTKFLWFGAGSVLLCCTVIGVLNAMWSAFSMLFGIGHKKEAEALVVQSNVPKTNRISGKNPEQVPKLQTGNAWVSRNIYENTYKLLLDEGMHLDVLGQIMFLESDLAVQPYHFTQRVRHSLESGLIREDAMLMFRHAENENFSFRVSVKGYLELKRHCFEDYDVEFLQFKHIRAHKRVSQNFLTEDELKYVSGLQGEISECVVDSRGSLTKNNICKLHAFTGGKVFPEIVTRPEWGVKRIKRAFRYRGVDTDKGSCGAPVCIKDNSSFMGRIAYGIHVAGTTDLREGYCAFVTREMIDKAKVSLNTITDNFVEDIQERKHGVALQIGGPTPFEEMGSFLSIGIAAKPVNLCPKTSYYPTKLFGAIGEYDHKPAPLSPVYRDGKLVYPMENAIRPYQSPVYIYEHPYIQTAMHVAMKPMLIETKGASRRVYTFEEAVLGVPCEKFRAIPRGTAAGFPYVYDVRDGKKEFFGADTVYDLTREKAVELKQRVEHIISSAERNVRLSHVFVDFLKDELRSSEKVEKVATRLISSAPLDYTVAWRMYFGAFTAAIMRHNVNTGMAPGLCSYSDWWKLVAHLKVHGKHCFDGDFKAFDSSEQPCVHELILDIVNTWYDDGETNARVRRVLWQDLVHSRHIGGKGNDQRYIYQWNKSLPSGHPFTTIVNSMYSLFLLVCAYIECTGDLSGYWDHVSAVTYGDDNNSNVSDAVIQSYNQRTVAIVLKEKFFITYTPGNKSDDFVESMPLEDTTFLKRGFSVGIDGGWVCPLDLNSFLYTFYWCKNRRLERKIMRDVMECALEELSMHDERTWRQYSGAIASLLEQAGHVTNVPCQQDQYLALVRSRTDNWY